MAVELQRNQHKRRKDENNNKNPLKKKSKRSTELKELALQEVTSLNNEIRHLEEEIFQRDSLCADTYTLESLEKIETELLTSDLPSSSKEDHRSELEKDIDVLNERLDSLEKLTWIRCAENSSKVLSRTDSSTVLLRRMSGTCQRIPFVVEFEVKEDEKKDSSFKSENKGQYFHVLVQFYPWFKILFTYLLGIANNVHVHVHV